jgi:adenylosuccinate synthase
MSVDVIVGLQRGDEGKGKFVDLLAEQHDIVARYNGGPNAGHTVRLPDGTDLALHQIPSGIAHPNVINIIGSGVLLDPAKLYDEIEEVRSKGIAVTPKNLMISSAAHLIMYHHVEWDRQRENSDDRQGSTQSGIAQAAAAKAIRTNLRTGSILHDPAGLSKHMFKGMHHLIGTCEDPDVKTEKAKRYDLTDEYFEKAMWLGDFIKDTVLFLGLELDKSKPPRILAEGAQAFLLDIDHGMYPFTTSTSTTAGGVANGLGIGTNLDRVTGVVKSIHSHVGDGPFVTEVHDETLFDQLHGDKDQIDSEVGTTTGRIRRLGHLDLPQLRRANMVNGTSDMALTKLDWLNRYDGDIPVCTNYRLGGELVEVAPDSADQLSQARPVYQRLPGWDDDISLVKRYKDLPRNARNYVEYLEQQTRKPISMIGVGPGREQVIVR